jgi:multidrug resistance efflux pump
MPQRRKTAPIALYSLARAAGWAGRLDRSLISLIALAVLAATLVGPSRAADVDSAARQVNRLRQEALQRFRKLSPEERLKRAEQVAGRRIFYLVTRGDLKVTVVERGTLDAAETRDLICRVKAQGKDSKQATRIKWVIDDGTLVKKGQRLLELADSELRDRLRARIILLDKAAADRLTAEENLKVVRKQNQLDIRTAEINHRLAKLRLKKFTGKDADEKEMLGLKVEQAQLALEMVKLQSNAKAIKAETDLKGKNAVEEVEVARKSDLEAQLAACVLKAPVAGMVTHHVADGSRWSARAVIVAEGEPVNEGQKLLHISDLGRFVVTCMVHEALVSQVHAGQRATVRVESFPRRALRGRVKSVATRAASQDFLSADVKVFPVTVELTEQLPGLKPGMSSEVEMEVLQRPKVLWLPVQSVLRDGRETFCYVQTDRGLQERKVKTGARNNFAVEITAGLKEEECVLAAPRAVAVLLARPAAKGPKQPADTRAPRRGRILVRSIKRSRDNTGTRARIESFGLTYQDLGSIRALPGVSAAVPVRTFPIEARRRTDLRLGRLIATVPEYRALSGIRLAAGRFLEEEDNLEMRNVAVLGADTAERLFPLQDPVGEVVNLGRRCAAFVVVGVLHKQDEPAGNLPPKQVNHGVYVPLRTCKTWFGGTIIMRLSGSYTAEAVPLNEILVAAEPSRHAPYVAECIAALLEQAHARKDWEVRTAGVVP